MKSAPKNKETWLQELYFSLIPDILGQDELIIKTLARTSLGLEQINRRFSHHYGETFQGCLRRLAMEHAAQQLRRTDLSVTDIALNASYGSPDSFSHAFKRHFQMSPSEYRERVQTAKNMFVLDNSKLKFESRAESLVICAPYVGDYQLLEEVFFELMKKARGLFGISLQTATPTAIYLDDPTISRTFVNRAYVGFQLTSSETIEIPAGSDFQSVLWPRGEYAVYDHVGSYSTVYVAHAALADHCLAAHGKKQVLANGIHNLSQFVSNPLRTHTDQLLACIHVPVADL